MSIKNIDLKIAFVSISLFKLLGLWKNAIGKKDKEWRDDGKRGGALRANSPTNDSGELLMNSCRHAETMSKKWQFFKIQLILKTLETLFKSIQTWSEWDFNAKMF